MALKIGITGGIGSGKSVICQVFKLLGAPVFEADVWAKKLMNSHPEIKTGLIDWYGSDIYSPNGTIDRKKLAGIIFTDSTAMQKVNGLIHPVVRQEFIIWADKQNSSYVVHEAAILFESGFYKMMDHTILVTAPEKMRIDRVTKRDGSTMEAVKERMGKQWGDEQKRELASLEIKNDNKTLLIPQIIEIDKKLKEYGKIW
ncbi:dephospho-CoA kinase [Draconibacterium orientale]|jgi:dephospho-CoA kinase|uniref:Dephospho-CoA kinase n=1 Tax=Draconibacterium orientale TaxID=1168034 RepID=X5DU73_9BACT|nr:dephospho-CoA kinase [Draconibacterium orientale]AHW58735.1 dephospho-CoA kinase [Draconibacterium orientale]SEU09530.1 dephospho-CoA kinase [Draconibacterium orientale]